VVGLVKRRMLAHSEKESSLEIMMMMTMTMMMMIISPFGQLGQ
jgi:hypothetical protein